MASIIVEYSFADAMSDEELTRMAERLDECLALRNGAWVRSSVSGDRKRMICEFEAPDAESVRDALRTARLAFDRVWPAQVFAVDDYPPHLEKLQRVRAAKTA